jgi:hypothetical protein
MAADFSNYVDLTIYDATATDIYLGSIELARLTLPEFSLRTGTVEDAIFQAMSYTQMLSVAAINRIPNRIMEGVLKLAGLERDSGSRAIIEVDVSLSSITSVTIPAGTAFTYEVAYGESSTIEYTFLASEDVTILETDFDAGEGETLPHKAVALTSQMIGEHILPFVGQELTIQDIFPDVLNATFTSSTQNGRNPEDDSAFLDRCLSTMQSFADANVTAQQLKTYILTTSEIVSRCKVYDLTSPLNVDLYPTPANPANGNVTVFTYGSNRMLTPLERSAISADVSSRAIAGLQINVIDMNLCDEFVVGIDAVVVPEYDLGEVEQAIRNVVFEFLSPLGFTSSAEGISSSEVSRLVLGVPGVAYVTSITFNETGSGEQFPSLAAVSFLPFAKKGSLPSLSSGALVIELTSATSIQSATIESL